VSLDPETLAQKSAAVERHLARVDARLPQRPEDLLPMSDAADAVVLHLWQATQIVIDLAVSAWVRLRLGAPTTYADAFRSLQRAGHLEPELADRLIHAAAFRNVVAHEYGRLDLARVHDAATRVPADLRAFLKVVARLA
jgi:uncharacterized protein YutE (UPF0331/DUF86 family)